MATKSRIPIHLKPAEENIPKHKNLQPGKKPPQTQRPALGEIGNKFVTRTNTTNVVVKKAPVKLPNSIPARAEPLQKKVEIPKTKNPAIKKPANQIAFSTTRFDVPDIDKDDDNPQLVGVYASDIYSYLKDMEAKFPITPNYLTGQLITGKMRAILVDWLVDVQQEFQMLQETLYLTVSCIDRFMQKVRNIRREKFQLVGMTAMFIASKYEETYLPNITDLVYISDNAFSKQDILQMEETIVKALDFSFGRPLQPHFLRRYSKAAQVQPKHHAMAKYFMEQCLLEYRMCHIPPSQIAAAAIYLSLRLLNPKDDDVWTGTLIHYSQYTYKDIQPVVKLMASFILNAETYKYQAVRRKYSNAKLLKISSAPELKSTILGSLAKS